MSPRTTILSRLFVSATLLYGAGACSNETPLASTIAPVVNGQMHTADPAVVFISFSGASCSGALVSKDVVLTARHCVLGVPQGNHRVGFGHGWDGGFTFIPTSGYAFIPGDNSDLSDDLAVLFLATEAPSGIAPLPVNAADLTPHIGDPMRLVGFGITNSGESDSGVKRQGTTLLTRVSSTLMFHGLMPAATCSGDSGGPQFMTIGGTEFITGVTSFGSSEGCHVGEHGAVRPDAFLPWLSQYFDTQFDKIAPTVQVTSPSDGASVTTGFQVIADASDDRKVNRVALSIDGVVVDADLFAPYELETPANLATGSHTLEVIAYDDYENATGVSLTVNLAPACTTDPDCGDGLECVDGVCGASIGTSCETAADCASGQCFHGDADLGSFCTQNCASSNECPSGFACAEPPLVPVTKCLPATGGSGPCAMVAPGRRAAWTAWTTLLLGLALLAVTRRRRRA